jgi:hypothetical protein
MATTNQAVPQSIIDRIQKLNALANRAGTEAEAALAAQRVADLCRAYNLEVGVAVLTREETKASESVQVHEESQWQAHWTWLACACDALFGVAHYRSNSYKPSRDANGFVDSTRHASLHFYGLKANVQSALLTYQYFLASVEALLEGAIPEFGLHGRTDMRSFRMGCAARIQQEAEKTAQLSRKQLENNPAAVVEVTALVRLENQLIKEHAKAMHLRSTGSIRGAGSRNAYAHGFAAGGRVDLHGARSSRMLR